MRPPGAQAAPATPLMNAGCAPTARPRNVWRTAVAPRTSGAAPILTAVASAPATLVAPAETIRVRYNQYRDTPLPPEVPFAHNPPPGAVIDYLLGSPAKSVRLEIVDGQGQLVRSFASDAPPENLPARRYFTELYVHPPAPPATEAGHHRFVWDLRYTRPKSHRYEYMISAIAGENTPVEPRGPLAMPGRYTVRLVVDGASFEQPLVLVMDPRVKVASEALDAQLALQKKLLAAMDESFAAAEKAKGTPEERPLAAVNDLFGNILNSLDGADVAPTTVQSEAFTRARAELDRLRTAPKKAPKKKASAASTTAPEVSDEYSVTDP